MDCTISVNKKAITSIRMLNVISTREDLNIFSMRIWRNALFILIDFQASILIIDEIPPGNEVPGEIPDFVIDNFKAIL
jgi:hypothetical protein